MIYNGIYHFFYQYNPHGAIWGNIVWAHSTSTDLINWNSHEPAIRPSQPSDIKGCWSGSATILPGNIPAMLYTGVDSMNNQVQNLAVPKNLSDPYLRVWTKSPKNPVMAPEVSNNIDPTFFRDPSTAWQGPDKIWRVIIGSKTGRRGLAVLYTSKDFMKWNLSKQQFYFSDNNGMWECPDFFPVSINGKEGVDTSATGSSLKHVVKVSLDESKHDHYTIGTYDLSKDVFISDLGPIDSVLGLRYDYGKFYASKTFFDSSKNRRILWGWINESSSSDDDVKKGWSGVQAVPRLVWLDKLGKQLVQWPIPELEQLRFDEVIFDNKVLNQGSLIEVSGITAAKADVEISFNVTEFEKAEMMDPRTRNPQLICSEEAAGSSCGGIGPFGLMVLASKGLQEYTAIFFRVFKNNDKYVVLMCSDQTRSSLNKENDKTTYGAFVDVDPVHEPISLRTLIDHSIVESFGGNGKSCITARVYPTIATGDNIQLYAFNNGRQRITISRMDAWSMRNARIT